jgi:hypothetical protein
MAIHSKAGNRMMLLTYEHFKGFYAIPHAELYENVLGSSVLVLLTGPVSRMWA